MSLVANLRTKSGKLLHPIGIGTWDYGTYPLFSPGTEAEVSAIRYAISLGQNHIDTAEMYAHGGAEQVVGRAIEPLNRVDLFVASKLWKDHVAEGMVRPAVEAMLQRLGTDYLDLLYIHAPWFDAPWQQAIPQVNRLVEDGIVRYFGVSNFNASRLEEALSLTRQPIVADQMHFNCLHQQEVTPKLRELCDANSIAIVAYMPLEKGEILKNSALANIAKTYNLAPAQAALSWLVAQHALPIAKALQKVHISQDAAAKDIMLPREAVSRINQLLPENV